MTAQDEPHTPPPLPDLDDGKNEQADPSRRASIRFGKLVVCAAAVAFLILLPAGLVYTLVGTHERTGRRKAEWDAKVQLMEFKALLDDYLVNSKKLPGSLSELTKASDRNPAPFINSIPDDPWGNPYVYRVIGASKFDLRSTGEDGIANTEDDITRRRD